MSLDVSPWTVNTLIMNHSKISTGAGFELAKPDPDCDFPKEGDLADGSRIPRHSEVSTGANFELARPAPVATEKHLPRRYFVENSGDSDTEAPAESVNLVNQLRKIPPVERFLLTRPNQSSASVRESTSKKERSL